MDFDERRSTASSQSSESSVQKLQINDVLSVGPEAEEGRARCQWFRQSSNIRLLLTILAVVLGATIGMLARMSDPSLKTITILKFPGDLMMNMLKMLMIPLIVSSIVAGITGFTSGTTSTRIIVITIVYFIVTTLLAVNLGIILVISIHPGSLSVNKNGKSKFEHPNIDSMLSLLDLFRNMVPDNLVTMCFQMKRTLIRSSNRTFAYEVKSVEGANALGLVSVSIFFGVVLRYISEKGKLLTQLFATINDFSMAMNNVAIWYTPIGIFFMVMGKLLEAEDLISILHSLGLFIATVISGLLIHSCITLSLCYVILTRKNPLLFFKGILQAWLTALSTASSVATLPITLKCLEDNLKIDQRVSKFTLPIGATINMDGTALYEAVACAFIAQVNGMKLNIGQVSTISATATLAAIGTANLPSAGLFSLVIVLTSVGLPPDDISLIIAVDWMLDRFRTSTNVFGDAVGACIVAHICGEQPKEDANQQNPATAAATSSVIQASPHAPPVNNDNFANL